MREHAGSFGHLGAQRILTAGNPLYLPRDTAGVGAGCNA